MDGNVVYWTVAVMAVLVAGVSKGGFGSGASFAATPMLALVMPVEQAVGLMLPLLIVMDFTGLKPFWRAWDWRNARALMLWAVPGVALGIVLFEWADPDAVRFMIGAIAIFFVAFQLAKARGWLDARVRPYSARSAAIAGVVAGFTSFVSHAGGPPVAIHLLGQGIGKLGYQATTMLVFGWINLVKLPPFVALGLITRETMLLGLLLAPAAILGTLAGVWAHRRLSDAWYFAAIYVFLTVTGAKLMWDAVH